MPLVACNDSRVEDGQVIGDPTEAALAGAGCQGWRRRGRRGREPPARGRDPVRLRPQVHGHLPPATATAFRCSSRARPMCCCSAAAADAAPTARRLDAVEAVHQIEEAYRSLAERGLRGLLIASRTLPADGFDADRRPRGLRLRSDLRRAGGARWIRHAPRRREAIALCRRAGIAVKMITGDHKATAIGDRARARPRRQSDHRRRARRAWTQPHLPTSIDEVAVFARVAPEHKVKIVRALAGEGACRRDDRGRRERCAGAEVRRHRRRDGHQRHGGRQGGRDAWC